MNPKVDERVDVVIDGVSRNVQHVMEKDVGVQRSHEQPRGGARIADADDAGRCGAAEIVLDDHQPAPRRAALVARQEPRVHEHGHVLGQDVLGERDELLGDAAQHDAGIGGGIDLGQLHDERRRLDRQVHGLGEEGLLRRHVPQHGGRRDVELAGDVGERGGFEAFRREHAAGHAQQLFFVDGGGPAHL